MKIYIYILLMSFNFSLLADCEIYPYTFQSIQERAFPTNTDKIVTFTSRRDGGILFKYQINNELEKFGFLKNINGRFGKMDNLSLDGASTKSIDSYFGIITFLKLKEDMIGLPSEQIALIDFKNREIEFANNKIKADKKIDFADISNMPSKLFEAILSSRKNNKLNIVYFDLDYAKLKALKWSIQKLGEEKWAAYNVLIEVPFKKPMELILDSSFITENNPAKTKTNNILQFWISFLSNDNETFWYIGNGNVLSIYSPNFIVEFQKGIFDSSVNHKITISEKLEFESGYSIKDHPNDLIYKINTSENFVYINWNSFIVELNTDSYRPKTQEEREGGDCGL